MSGIPTDLTHSLTCLVKDSNLSCSQVIWRPWPIAAALHAQIKTWIWVIHKNGCLLSRLSCCVRCVGPPPSWNHRPAQDVKLAPRSDRHRQAPHHGLWPFPPLDSCIVLARTKGCWDAGNQRGDKVAEPQSAAGSLWGLFPVPSEVCVLGGGTNLAGLDMSSA